MVNQIKTDLIENDAPNRVYVHIFFFSISITWTVAHLYENNEEIITNSEKNKTPSWSLKGNRRQGPRELAVAPQQQQTNVCW